MLEHKETKTVRKFSSEYATVWMETYVDMPGACVLTHLFVKESYRKKGYGNQALNDIETIAKNNYNCLMCYLKVEVGSWIHNWYLRRGYEYWQDDEDPEYVWLFKNLRK